MRCNCDTVHWRHVTFVTSRGICFIPYTEAIPMMTLQLIRQFSLCRGLTTLRDVLTAQLCYISGN